MRNNNKTTKLIYIYLFIHKPGKKLSDYQNISLTTPRAHMNGRNLYESTRQQPQTSQKQKAESIIVSWLAIEIRSIEQIDLKIKQSFVNLT